MITRFRKGQQIRQNDLNNIINGLTGRMIGGPGINVRKMAGGMVIDADVRAGVGARVADANLFRIDKNDFTMKAKALYSTYPQYRVNLNFNDGKIIFCSNGEPVRIVDSDTLSLVDYADVQSEPGAGGLGNNVYSNCVTDSGHIFVNYFLNNPYEFFVEKYNYSFSLIKSESYSPFFNNVFIYQNITGINNTTDYVVSSRQIHDKNIDSLGTLPSSALSSAHTQGDVFCDDDYIFQAISNTSGTVTPYLGKYNTDGSVVELLSSGIDRQRSSLWVDGSDLYYAWSTSPSNWYIEIYDYSLSKQDELTSSDMPDEIWRPTSITIDGNYIYFASTVSNKKEIVKMNKTNFNIESRRTIPTEGSIRNLRIFGDNVYVICDTGN